MSPDLKQLQHISDIRGIAGSLSGNEIVILNVDVIKKLTTAFLHWLSKKSSKPVDGLKISIGIDSRISGPELKSASVNVMLRAGAHVLDCNMATAASLNQSIINSEYYCDGAIMITASHLPGNWNGIKFISKNGVLDKEDIGEIVNLAEKGIIVQEGKGKREEINILSVYSKSIVDYILKKCDENGRNKNLLKGLNIIVDAANGAGGFFVKNILGPLGANTDGSIFLEPDGNFPNHLPNTEDDAALKPLQQAVIENNGHLGILFDSSCDKVAFVDSKGHPIKRDRLVALVAAIVMEENPKATIVTDSITSDALTTFIQKNLGGIHHRFKRGYKRVINEAMRLNWENLKCPVAIETSGHSAFSENNFIDDGIFLAAKVLVRLAKLTQEGKHDICELIKDFQNPNESLQFRMKINANDFEMESNRIIQTIKRFAEGVPGWKIIQNNFDGIRVSADKYFGDGWFLLRNSLHEPKLVLNVESSSQRGIKMTLNRLMKVFGKINSLNSAEISGYLGSL